MLLPYVIQYLEALGAPGGQRICERGGFQILIPIVPPNTVLRFSITPPMGLYAVINFRISFHHAMVPGAWRLIITEWGGIPFTGVVGSDEIAHGRENICFIRHSDPALIEFQNLTGLNQFCCVSSEHIQISSEDDYNFVMKTLERLETSAETERLLTSIDKKLGGGG